jgi:hypothetical protein
MRKKRAVLGGSPFQEEAAPFLTRLISSHLEAKVKIMPFHLLEETQP